MDPSLSERAEFLDSTEMVRQRPDRALSSLTGATGWLNSPPMRAPELHGRVVLVEFLTYTCINWLRTLPHVRAWIERYTSHGLAVIGVHTPEFDFERDVDNVRRAVDDLRVGFPIAVDNDYAIWDGFGNRYWPALYLLDTQGEIRHHRFGEGDYERSERVVRRLLTEAGAGGMGQHQEPAPVEGRGVEASADWDSLESPENYLGYERSENFVSGSGKAVDANQTYALPTRLQLNHWALSGDWTITRRAAIVNRAEGRIAYRFHARDLHLVMAPIGRGDSARFRVDLDGRPPRAAHGADVDDHGSGTVTEPRLYQLVRQPYPVSDRTFEITFLDPGVRVYAVTFG
jgi:hypothetical protein